MSRIVAQRPYRWLAEYYDELFGAARFPMQRARQRILDRKLPGVKTACDLACGTGTTALSLARRGIRMYAVDLSPAMCRVTRAKAKRAGLAVQVINADMRSFRLPEPVDLVTCEYDALNHIPARSHLRKVLQAVQHALRPGGYFYFDVNNALGFERYWLGNVWIENPRAAVVMRNGHDLGAKKAWSDIEWFFRSGKLWQRHRERVEEVCWSLAEIRRSLRAAGFHRVRAWDAMPFFKENALMRPGCHTFYLAQKSPKAN